MYGYLTIEQCDNLSELGYAIVCDGDKQDTYIRDSEKEYIAEHIPNVIEIIRNICDSIANSLKGVLRDVGETLIKLSK